MSTTAPAPEETPETPTAAAEQPNEERFRWNAWLHVGPGADTCEKRETGACSDDEHFHAWVRVPNPFQVGDINEKAKAARARRLKTLRDLDSDARVILEEALDELREACELDRSALVNELVDKHFQEDYRRAMMDVEAEEDPDWSPPEDADEDGAIQEPPKLWANIDQDREEYARQLNLPEDERDEDFPTLRASVAAYSQSVDKKLLEFQEPRRERLMNRDLDDLMEMVRRDRMDAEAAETYMRTYNYWQWFVCTLKKPNGERMWGDIQHMKNTAPPHIVAALRHTFEALEVALSTRERGSGNS